MLTVLVTVPSATKISLSPAIILRIDLVTLLSMNESRPSSSMEATPNARTFCSGLKKGSPSVIVNVSMVTPSRTITRAQWTVAVPVPAALSNAKLQRIPLMVHGKVTVSKVVVTSVAATAVLLTAIKDLSIGLEADRAADTRLRFTKRDMVCLLIEVNSVVCYKIGRKTGNKRYRYRGDR